LTGHENAEELAGLEEALERFEAAVQGRGGDLMMDEGPEGQTPSQTTRISPCRGGTTTSP